MLNQGWIYREQVKPNEAGQTILDYYTQKHRHSSQQEWQVRIESGQILVNNQAVSPETIVQAKDQLAYQRSPWLEPEVPLEFAVLYEDEDLLVINKPSGLPVIPGGGFLEHTLLWQLKKLYPQNTPVPIHRLGRGTSGLMLLGRSPLGKSVLAQQMRHCTIKQENSHITKVYRVLVQGDFLNYDSLISGDRLNIDQPIGKIDHPILGYIYGATNQGKSARSECRVIKRYGHCTLLEVRIFTGRPHQIRIHLAAVGYPLLGDPLYIAGGTFAPIDASQHNIPVPSDCGYFLHAYRLSFSHPQTRQQLNFKCPPPEAWSLGTNLF